MLHAIAEPSPVPFRPVQQPTAPDLARDILVDSQGVTGSPVLLITLVVALVALVFALIYVARLRRRATPAPPMPGYGSPSGAYGAPPQSLGYRMGSTAQNVAALVPCAACANPLSPAAVQCPRCGHPGRPAQG
jgi:hypothetical protein